MVESSSILMQSLGQAAIKKVDLVDESPGRYILRAFFAGMYLMFGTTIAVVVANYFESPGVSKVLYALTFGWGLVMILTLNGELTTSNMMYLTTASINRYIPVKKAGYVLALCILGNLLGSLVTAYAISKTGLFNGVSGDHYLFTIVSGKITKNYGLVLLDSILANILVNIAIIGANRLKNEMANSFYVLGILFMFSVFGFEHVIANFGSFSLAKFTGVDFVEGFTWSKLIIHWLVSIVGNYIGGGLIMGGLYTWLNKTKTNYTD